MFRQYLDLKKAYPGTLLFFRLGDFYELFAEDAITGARELQITLTARQKDSPNPIPMCGVPHHAASGYIAKLVRKGYRVAMCEQAEAAGKGVKLVKRKVVRVITPGTAIDEHFTEPGEAVFLCSVSSSSEHVGAAFIDLSTGEFFATQTSGSEAWQKLRDHLDTFGPKEVLVAEGQSSSICENLGIKVPAVQPLLGSTTNNALVDPANPLITAVQNSSFDLQSATRQLMKQFGVRTLSGFGLDGRDEAVRASGAVLSYVKETQKAAAEHICEIRYFETNDFLVLDATTIANLDLIKSRGDFRGRSLFDVIDETVTPMGKRLLKHWLLRPSVKRGEIETRQAAVRELGDAILRSTICLALEKVADLERLTGKLNLASATPRDLVALRNSLEQVPVLTEALAEADSLLLQVLAENIFSLPETRDLIAAAIVNDPSNSPGDGGVIRREFDAELDELRQLANSGKQTIASFEALERERTAIATLKVRFNNVFGYYIEISRAQLTKVPDNYERRQTLANAERFTTPELKQWEQKVRGAEDRISQIEADLFRKVVETVQGETKRLLSTARAIATLDVLASLAECAGCRNYVAPLLHDGDEIEVKNGRHPIVEASIDGEFVPNDAYLNNSTDRLLIVTGANMGGKSTILRQIALIQILAQIGSFVPASSARMPIVDRIWTRVGASDDLASGRSTFMVEMTETATILHNATPRSLILLDEIGRGTSTFDGLSIAWAVAEYLHDSSEHSAKTLFATHYHELTELAEHLPGAKNYQITATERDGEVAFLHKLQAGKASKSYGIAVAKLAGLPVKVIERAKDVLTKLEKYELAVFKQEKQSGLSAAAGRSAASQVSLFAIANENAIDQLRAVNVENLSPEDSKALLAEIREKLN
ncbi:MAG: DNA mismatch repair protein MutS [Acidobacteria bacterium]|nr:MAG: DNA mismatch repair protein MutS [Acidobacteriota bacterium]